MKDNIYKVGNKTANKQERQRKKESKRERSKYICKKTSAFAHAWKTIKLFNYVRLVKKYAFFFGKIIFSHFYAD